MTFRALTARFRLLPDIYVLGQVRCGTTSTAAQLSRFPGAHGPFCPWRVPFADDKESFFLVGHFFGHVHPDLYRMCFPLKITAWFETKVLHRKFFVFDACAQYLSAPWCAELIERATPHARFIVNVRNPIDQNKSWWHFEQNSMQWGTEMGMGSDWLKERQPPDSLHSALLSSESVEVDSLYRDATLSAVMNNHWKVPGWMGSFPGGQLAGIGKLGRFADDITRYCKLFGASRIGIIEISELSGDDFPSTLTKINSLLPSHSRATPSEINEICNMGTIHANSAGGAKSQLLSEFEEEQWRTFYAPHNEALFDMCGNPSILAWNKPAHLEDQFLVPVCALGPEQLMKVHSSLPRRFRPRDLKRVFNANEDGYSMQTLLQRLKESRATASILVIRDTAGKVFGGFASQTWAIQPGFFGNGQTFLFECLADGGITIYPWVEDTARFYMFCETADFGFGPKALRLDKDLLFGSSHADTTFGSPTLSSSAEFKCANVECVVLL